MRLSVWFGLVLIFAGCTGRAADPSKLSSDDRNTLLRTDAQLQLLSTKAQQIQSEAQPIYEEQQSVVARVCKAAKIALVADCLIDAKAGTVKRKEPVKPSPPLPAKK